MKSLRFFSGAFRLPRLPPIWFDRIGNNRSMRSNQAAHVLDVSGRFFESLDAEDDDARECLVILA